MAATTPDRLRRGLDELDRMLLAATQGTKLPIAVDFDFGHTDPMCSLPWGIAARLEGPRLTLLEPAVT